METEELSAENPKSHDSLFKWLIAAFTDDFFAHYFPDIKTGKYTCIDKEFISRYKALKESLKADMFIAIEIEINGKLQDVVIHIEHESKKRDMSRRVFRYLCYAWLLKEKPVWSIVIYADNSTKWHSPVPGSFVYGFDSKNKEQHHKFDIIRIKDEKSKDLISKSSLMCKLLALKADDRGTDRKELIGSILKTIAANEFDMDDHIKLLVLQWIDFYSNVSPEALRNIKKEVEMISTAATITEHYLNKGIARGIAKGEKRGIAKGEKKGIVKGKIQGKIESLTSLYSQGILSEIKYNEMVNPLQRELIRIS